MRTDRPPAWITGRDPGKVLVATDLVFRVGKAAHWIFGHDTTPLALDVTDAIIIAHIPLSSFARFKRKVRNAESLLRDSLGHFPGETAWHWKRWVELARAGQLPDEYDRQLTDPIALLEMQQTGKVRKASDLLLQRITVDR